MVTVVAVNTATIEAITTMGTTTIEIDREQWADLNALKDEPGDSMKDVVDELLAVRREVEQKGIGLDCLTDDEPDHEAIAEQHRTFVDVADSVDESPITDAKRTPAADAGDESRPDLAGALAEQADQWREHHPDDAVEQRVEAARAAVEYLAEEGGASKSDVVDDVEPDHPVDGQSPRTWYRKTVRPVFDAVAEYDNSRREYVVDV